MENGILGQIYECLLISLVQEQRLHKTVNKMPCLLVLDSPQNIKLVHILLSSESQGLWILSIIWSYK
jgi:hypothetical protein